jgi:5,10-methylenetetrahydrofolate reductase
LSVAVAAPYVDPADPLPDLPGHSSRGRLERVLRSGRFAVTSELNPPDSADPREVFERAVVLAEVCDAINAVDASGAHVHMSSVGICALLTRAGYAVVMQVACRDRNRIAIQGDVLGAAAMGVQNVLCLTGDGVQCGDQPGAKPVFDLDSVSLLETIRVMRDEGRFLSGRKLTTPPRVFLGAAANPFAPPYDYRPLHLAKKVAAGAQFIQTQYCFDLPLLERFMARVRDQGLHERCFILVGVGPLASARTARWMRANVPGVHIPDAVVERLEKAPNPKAARLEGRRLCVEMIQRVREVEGVRGVHVMAYRQEELVSEVIQESGVLAGRRARRVRAAEREGAAAP